VPRTQHLPRQKADSLSFRRTQKLTAQRVKALAAGDKSAVADIDKAIAKTSPGVFFTTYAEAIDWLEAIRQKWNAKPHSSLKRMKDPVTGNQRHQSPQEALDEWKANGWQPVLMDDAHLTDLFRPRVGLKVRRGTVKPYGGKDGPRFRHTELDHWEGLAVVVAYDIMDYRQVWVYTPKGELICEAAFDEQVSYRSQTAYDAANEKRALAQLRRLEKKAETVKRRAGLEDKPAIDSTAIQIFDFPMKAVEPELVAVNFEGINSADEADIGQAATTDGLFITTHAAAEDETAQPSYADTVMLLWGNVNDDDEESKDGTGH